MSALAWQHVEDYLRLRRCSGHKLDEHARLLPRFAAYLDATGAEYVTIDLALAWATSATAGRESRPGAADARRPRFRALPGGHRPATEVPPPG